MPRFLFCSLSPSLTNTHSLFLIVLSFLFCLSTLLTLCFCAVLLLCWLQHTGWVSMQQAPRPYTSLVCHLATSFPCLHPHRIRIRVGLCLSAFVPLKTKKKKKSSCDTPAPPPPPPPPLHNRYKKYAETRTKIRRPNGVSDPEHFVSFFLILYFYNSFFPIL